MCTAGFQPANDVSADNFVIIGKSRIQYMDYFQTQKLLVELTPEFQANVTDKSLLIVGLGGNGSHVAIAALRMGFREIVGIDCDIVTPGNLSRQILYTPADIGQTKADAARKSLERNNLCSKLETHHLNILENRADFGRLIDSADLIFIVVDQPYTTFFAIDACFHFHKPAIVGGTCVLSGTSTRVSWMDGRTSPCLNCSTRINQARAEWAEYYRYDGRERVKRSPAVEKVDAAISLSGGHPSIYPTASIGSNMMIALALNYFMGKRDMPRITVFSILNFVLEMESIKLNAKCATCGSLRK
jgi:molybdopterin/thiamine biosynthesis adenylyltransferase